VTPAAGKGLPPAAPRRLTHRREIVLNGYERQDGLFDIEARLCDSKPMDMPMEDRRGGRIAAGEPLHEMTLRVTIDATMTIRGCAAEITHGPFHACSAAGRHFERLAGLAIRKGFLREAAERVGGIDGCTHLRELLQQIGTTAYQTLWPLRARQAEAARGPGDEAPGSELVNSCHAFADTGPVVKRRWPRRWRGTTEDVSG
jgi:hypothetical protein